MIVSVPAAPEGQLAPSFTHLLRIAYSSFVSLSPTAGMTLTF